MYTALLRKLCFIIIVQMFTRTVFSILRTVTLLLHTVFERKRLCKRLYVSYRISERANAQLIQLVACHQLLAMHVTLYFSISCYTLCFSC
jgi:hypothetical protein